MDDGVNDPDNINGYFDSIPKDDNVLPFQRSRAPRSERRPDLPTITLEAGELHNIATEAEDALIQSETPYFVRGENLVRPVTDDLPASHGRITKVARLAAVTEASLIDRLSRSANWQKWDGRAKRHIPVDPTPKVAAIVMARDGDWKFRLRRCALTARSFPSQAMMRRPSCCCSTRQRCRISRRVRHGITRSRRSSAWTTFSTNSRSWTPPAARLRCPR
jgi:hypothetical protein